MKKSDKIPEGNPFKVPENYLEEVNRKIIAATALESPEIKKPGLYIRLRPYIAVAASVTILAIMSYTGMKLFSPKNESLSLSGIPVEVYSETLLNEIDNLTLEENVSLSEIPEAEDRIENKDIIEYLLLENIDINEIQENL
jgi:hypothetical protein